MVGGQVIDEILVWVMFYFVGVHMGIWVERKWQEDA